jgi:putative two-component system response regulator
MSPDLSLLDPAQSCILIVDDVPANLAVLGEVLRASGYHVKVAINGLAALKIAAAVPQPDLILLDVMMPDMDGYEVLRRLSSQAATQHIPVMFLTALGDPQDEERGLALGAADYLTKPIQPAVVRARVRTQLLAKQALAWLQDQNVLLEAEVSRRMRENERVQQVTIRALAHLAETRDADTGHHIQRTQAYVRLLALALRTDPQHSARLTDHYIDLLERSAPLHDIGKVGIPDHILLKPGVLLPEEWAVMQTHATLGARAIEQAEADIDQPLEFLVLAKEIAHWHHERWDGHGYPDGLAGEAIPLSARLMAVADMYDALVSRRVYKGPMAAALARDLILRGAGSQFDPAVVRAFQACFEAFVEVQQRVQAHADA